MLWLEAKQNDMSFTKFDIPERPFSTDAFVPLNPAAHEGIEVGVGSDLFSTFHLKRGT